MRELTIENSMSTAIDVYCKLADAGVTYVKASALNRLLPKPEPLPTYVIEARPKVECSIHKDPYPGWKPPGNYHHRRGRK